MAEDAERDFNQQHDETIEQYKQRIAEEVSKLPRRQRRAFWSKLEKHVRKQR